MKFDASFQTDYPLLTKWIKENLPKVKDKGKVWTAFVKYSELSARHAIIAIKTSPTPVLRSKIMPGANGQFSGATAPNDIFIAEEICRRFEKSDSKNAKMHILVESTILHEMVHWGDWKDKKDQVGEEGKDFEKEAYGADVDRYW